MKNNYTHIAVILDRTGSMESIHDDTIGGFNTFLTQQKAEPGEATLTLVQFDTQDPYEVIQKFKPLIEVPELTRETFVPRASTPLLDAMGRGINDLEKSLAEMKEDERPSCVVMVIITDGQENSSREFRKSQIEKMIKEKQEKSAWQFVFLSADLAAIGDALDSGIHAASSMAFDKTAHGTAAAWSSASARIADFRAGRSKAVSFKEEDRSQQQSEQKRERVQAMKPFNTRIPRERAAQYGKQAVQIIQAGKYRAPSGRLVSIADLIERSKQGTTSYPPDVLLSETHKGAYQTRIEIANETTLATVPRLRMSGYHPVTLNFASAIHPGGGFLSGARAQEEYLAWSSGLYASLRANPMYDFHRARHDPLYTNYAIYSPEVPVFRDDDGTLLETPYTVGIITSPAVNAKALHPARQPEIRPAMWSRILKVLSIGVFHAHDSIVLGAWGCGAFGNNNSDIAQLFQKALEENFNGAYSRVIFAIVDWSPEKRFIGPFQRVFESSNDQAMR